jgi:hypothetical protein
MHRLCYLDVWCLMSVVAELVTLMYGEHSFVRLKYVKFGKCNEISLFYYCTESRFI